MSDLTEWLKSYEWLPAWMRDFHDQKDLFKALQQIVTNRRQDGDYTLEGITWCAAHVYVIDVFLWTMARAGWTLQRSRKAGLEFIDLPAAVQQHKEEMRKASAAMIATHLNAMRERASAEEAP